MRQLFSDIGQQAVQTAIPEKGKLMRRVPHLFWISTGSWRWSRDQSAYMTFHGTAATEQIEIIGVK